MTYSDADSGLMPKILILLEDKGIASFNIGGHGQRHWVPVERHEEAVALLKAAPYADQLRIHRIEAGPRPGAKLPRVGPAEGEGWKSLATFARGELTVAEVTDLLHQADCEAGLVTYGTQPTKTSVLVPSHQASQARKALQAASFAERLKFDP